MQGVLRVELFSVHPGKFCDLRLGDKMAAAAQQVTWLPEILEEFVAGEPGKI